MADLQYLTLSHVKRVFDMYDDMSANNYISQNMIVVRNPPLLWLKQLLTNEPHVLKEMRIVILKKGWVKPTLNLMNYHFEEGELFFLASNAIAQIQDCSDDLDGIGFSLSDDLFGLALGNHAPKAFDGHLREFHFHLKPRDMEFLDQLHHLIYNNIRQDNHSAQVTLHLISTFLWYVDYLYGQSEENNRQTQSREQRLFSDFMQLVSNNAARQHQLDFYASQLCLSTRYVSTLIKKVSGKSAKAWIDDAIIARIKIELKHSDKSVNQIADEMDFPNPSFMCKYFKRNTGVTPMEYRKK